MTKDESAEYAKLVAEVAAVEVALENMGIDPQVIRPHVTTTSNPNFQFNNQTAPLLSGGWVADSEL